MKKIIVLTSALLFMGLIGVQAQSGGSPTGSARQQKAVGKVQKPDLGQAQGTGVPYKKPRSNHNVPNPGVKTGPDAKATGQFTPGSHTAQRENKMGRKTKQIDPVPKSDKPNQ